MQLATSTIQQSAQQACYFHQQQQFAQAWAKFSVLTYEELTRMNITGQAADCAYRVGQLEAAEELFNLALSHLRIQDPRALSYRFNLALIYFQRQQWTPCIDALSKVQRAHPAHQRSAELLTQVRLLRGTDKDIKLALVALKQLLKKEPLNRKALQLWAETRWLQNESDWSGPYDAALQVPGHETILVEYIQKLTSLNLLEQAQQVLTNYAGRGMEHASSPYYQYCAALLCYQQGRPVDAQSWLAKLPPAWLASYAIGELRIKVLLANGETDTALTLARDRVKASPGKRVEQGDWALLATALKFSQCDDEYRRLYDFDRFVRVMPIECPPGYDSLDDFHQSLISQLDSLHRDKNHPLNQSLRSGSQTQGHLFRQGVADVEALENAIRQQLTHYIESLADDSEHPFLSRKAKDILFTGAWSVKLREQGFHQNHFHNEGWISGCYYVQIPNAVEKEGQGWIKFGQIESVQTITDTADFMVRPRAGHVVFFPSYMWHGTQAFTDNNFRITVAFDLIPG
ncbi:hypothetical protein CWE12_11705 [Aliidiomarina sedimenti]|uniref:Tetratricopeptide repeat protein n=1 Tax=Aliidiomarina sedimenti TaxID=1933879 RepID=A0ABY0BXI2_9GAMM|nr:putative 2OG-Fe(II) oxygenase [Aliidiomarina sedimenti]RUO28948.1 hypothetical protein CWE12_11705 [Aliidiomarina sedimenti]